MVDPRHDSYLHRLAHRRATGNLPRRIQKSTTDTETPTGCLPDRVDELCFHVSNTQHTPESGVRFRLMKYIRLSKRIEAIKSMPRVLPPWSFAFMMTGCTNAAELTATKSAHGIHSDETAVPSDQPWEIGRPKTGSPPPYSDCRHHTVNANLAILLTIGGISALGLMEPFVRSTGGRRRQNHAFEHVSVATLVFAVAPMVFHRAGGIEDDVSGPLLALWAGGYLNLVVRGVLLVKHERAGHLSPLILIGALAISNTLFLVIKDHSSRLWVTMAALMLTLAQCVGLKAVYGGLTATQMQTPGELEMQRPST